MQKIQCPLLTSLLQNPALAEMFYHMVYDTCENERRKYAICFLEAILKQVELNA